MQTYKTKRVELCGHKVAATTAKAIKMRKAGEKIKTISASLAMSEEAVSKALQTGIRIGALERTAYHAIGAHYLGVSLATGLPAYFAGAKSLVAHGFSTTQVYDCINGKRPDYAGFTWSRCTKEQYEAAKL